MSSHPSGTVTFLFTDIEGSAKLAQSLGDQWESLRARHHEMLKEAIEANHGYVFQIIGDAFCVAFHNAEDTFKSAVQSQTDLQADDWGDSPIKVRMGIHTGKANVQEDGQYQGYLALSLVQRIMSCGHGNQTLLSGATENLLRGTLPLEAFHTYDPHGTALIPGTLKTAIKESMVGPIWPWNKRLLDRAEAHCREVLGDEGFESAFEEGPKFSLDDTLNLVLQSVDEE